MEFQMVVALVVLWLMNIVCILFLFTTFSVGKNLLDSLNVLTVRNTINYLRASVKSVINQCKKIHTGIRVHSLGKYQ